MNRLEPAPGVELLDDPAAEPARVRESLRNIARANFWFGGAAAVRYGLRAAFAGAEMPAHPLSFLDVGTGMGDLPRMAVGWGRARGITFKPLGLELHAAAAHLARQEGLAVLVGCGGTLPIRDRGVDVVLLSQVAHHFAPDAIVRLVRECTRVARRAVILSDLRRSGLAALGFRLAGHALRFDAETMRDGVTSLRRGFSAATLTELLSRAGIEARVSRRPGARLVAVWRPPA
ncbi:MAG TPA: methyltransferase domain-containing protein [Gemmatimonadales bacterium]|nr:methyltransferase domain-containing protein [Gemmatimonadales bacterium]